MERPGAPQPVASKTRSRLAKLAGEPYDDNKLQVKARRHYARHEAALRDLPRAGPFLRSVPSHGPRRLGTGAWADETLAATGPWGAKRVAVACSIDRICERSVLAMARAIRPACRMTKGAAQSLWLSRAIVLGIAAVGIMLGQIFRWM